MQESLEGEGVEQALEGQQWGAKTSSKDGEPLGKKVPYIGPPPPKSNRYVHFRALTVLPLAPAAVPLKYLTKKHVIQKVGKAFGGTGPVIVAAK